MLSVINLRQQKMVRSQNTTSNGILLRFNMIVPFRVFVKNLSVDLDARAGLALLQQRLQLTFDRLDIPRLQDSEFQNSYIEQGTYSVLSGPANI
jgi:hypothetical protein